MPGTDPAEALRVILGELPDLPHLPELPGRGPGADLTGRTAALLVDLPVETTPSGWRLAASPGRDLRRARGYLARDLDVLAEVAAGYAGPFKIQVCGPWTLAATIDLGSDRNPALADAATLPSAFPVRACCYNSTNLRFLPCSPGLCRRRAALAGFPRSTGPPRSR